MDGVAWFADGVQREGEMELPCALVQVNGVGAKCSFGVLLVQERRVETWSLPANAVEDLGTSGMTVIFRVQAPRDANAGRLKPTAQIVPFPDVVPVIVDECRRAEAEV